MSRDGVSVWDDTLVDTNDTWRTHYSQADQLARMLLGYPLEYLWAIRLGTGMRIYYMTCIIINRKTHLESSLEMQSSSKR